MKITVIYGEYLAESRKKFSFYKRALKEKNWEIIRVDASEKSATEVISTGSLFQENVLYVLEDIKKIRPKDLEFLKTASLNISLLVWIKGSLSAGIKKNFPKGTTFEKFDLPQKIFKFLESFYPGNSRACLVLLHEVLEKENKEFILALLLRHIRDLYLYKLDSKNLNYPSWRMGKISFQAEKFTKNKIKGIIKKLAKADVNSKTGLADLELSLDLTIARELE
jgi:DNA polymerase III delta subunit